MKVREKFARETAYQLHDELQIGQYPVNMEQVCTAKGWIVGTSRLVRENCDAVTMHIDGEYGIYLADSIKSPRRIRWTLCHEIGHILLGHFEEFDLTFCHCEELGRGTAWILNRETNIFTEEFLMPAEFIRANISQGFEPLRAACGVSRQALEIRLKTLGLPMPLAYAGQEPGYGLGRVAEAKRTGYLG